MVAITRWFKKNKDVSLPAAFEQALAEGRLRDALSSLLELTASVPSDDDATVRVATGVSRVAHSAGLEELAASARRVAEAPRDVGALDRLTDRLREAGLTLVRLSFNERLAALAAGEIKALQKLAIAYEDAARYNDAYQIYEQHSDRIPDPFGRYLHAFTSFMSGLPARSRDLLPDPGAIDDEGFQGMVERLREMQQRADLVSTVSALDHQDLRGWHFAITGAVLLTTSPYGPEEMGGRYGWLADSVENCLLGIRRLRAVWQAWGVVPPAILYPPDRESQALARALAVIWDRPLREFGSPEEGLVVVYSLDHLDADMFRALAAFAPNRPLFVHATRWTGSDQYAADVTTLLAQQISHPWHERMRVVGDPADRPPRQIETIPADDSPAEVLADQILAAADVSAGHDLSDQALGDFARAVRPLATAFRHQGDRLRMWEGGPVRSNRFL